MPRPRKPKTHPAADPKILEVLVALSTGEIEVATAASLLGQTEEEFIDFVEANPSLVREAEGIAKQQRLDPERTLERSSAGLAAAITTLASRIENHGNEMTTGELVAASGLLEKLLAISEQRKAEIKGAAGGSDKESTTARIPIVISDTRPCPATGKSRLSIIVVEPGSPSWVDFSDPAYQAPNFCWLSTFLPMSPRGGTLDLTKLTQQVGFRFMDERGRIFGGHV